MDQVTNRLLAVSKLVGKGLFNFDITVGVRGTDKVTEDLSTTCITKILHESVELLDHVWIRDFLGIGAKYKQGTKLHVIAKINTRKRPSNSIYDKPTEDIKFTIREVLNEIY